MATRIIKTVKPSAGDYTSFAGAIAGEVSDFVAGDKIIELDLYAMQDTAQAVVAGATTDATRYWDIVAIDIHSGVYNTAKYRLEPTDVDALIIDDEFVRVYGMQINVKTPTVPRIELYLRFIAATSDVRVERFIIAGNGANSPGIATETGAFTSKLGNGVIYDCTQAFAGGLRFSGGGLCYAEDLTFNNCYYGIRDSHAVGGTVTAKNVIASAPTDTGFLLDAGSWGTGTDYNASSDGTSTAGTHNRVSQTFTFVNAAGKDFHLSGSDAGAKGFGTDLSADANYPLTKDIDGETPATPWNIGADQVAAAGGGGGGVQLIGQVQL